MTENHHIAGKTVGRNECSRSPVDFADTHHIARSMDKARGPR